VRPTSDKSPSPEDRAVARRHAAEIARLLDSEAVSYRRITLGEPQCSYRVPFHAEDFWFKVLVSDTDFVFTGEHRRRESFTVPFCASLKQGWQNLAATTLLPRLSAELGISVYTSKRFTEADVSSRVLTPAVRKLVRQLDLAPVRLLFLNSIQIHATSELITPEHCVRQVRLLRDLLLMVYHETHDSSGDRAA
jgi:hypothetical protein